MAQKDNPNNKFRLTISGNGINVDRVIDGQTLGAVMGLVMGTDKPVARPPASGSGPTPSTGDATVQMSLREFLDDVRAKRKPDQVVAIGHYLTQVEGQVDFSRDEVKARFSVAREPMPANFSRDFGLAEKAGMVAQMHGKQGRYYVTKTGLGAIHRKFSNDKVK